jgi:hypothetical protein
MLAIILSASIFRDLADLGGIIAAPGLILVAFVIFIYGMQAILLLLGCAGTGLLVAYGATYLGLPVWLANTIGFFMAAWMIVFTSLDLLGINPADVGNALGSFASNVRHSVREEWQRISEQRLAPRPIANPNPSAMERLDRIGAVALRFIVIAALCWYIYSLFAR